MMTDTRIGRGATIRHRAGVAAVAAAWIALAWTACVVLTGGAVLRVSGRVVSARDPLRPLAIASACFVAARLLLGSARFVRSVQIVTGRRVAERSQRVTMAVAAAVLVFSIAWNTRAAGGSDSSCYALQAEAFAHGRATVVNPIAALLPDAPPAVFAPIGFIPSPRARGDAVPICGAGLSLLMAPAFLVRRDAIFLLVPVAAVLLVWLTFLYGRCLDGDITGACAALLLACSPIFLYQAVQPMSDVPAAAAWMGALVAASRQDRRGWLLAGLCGSLAALIRANLAPLVLLLPALQVRPKPELRNLSIVIFVAALLPVVAVWLALNAIRYGSPLSSGYGDTGTLFSFGHVVPNLTRYPRWLLQTQPPLALLIALPAWVKRCGESRRLALVSLGCVAVLFGTYLLYTVFDDWWYIRFLLPALPILLVFSVAILRDVTTSLRPSRGIAVVAAVVLGSSFLAVRTGRERHVFELQALESRFRLAGEYAARELPANAVVLAVQQSGSLRFHGARDTVAWDAVPEHALDEYVERLRAAGRATFLALEDDEEARFRSRFAGQSVGALDWPPFAELHAPRRVRFYDPAGAENRPRARKSAPTRK